MVRASALGLTVLTGATGLVYEVTWQRYLATLLGSHAEATAARHEAMRAARRGTAEGQAIPLELVPPLASLYGVGGRGRARPLDAAERATENFRRDYHHAASFSRRALAGLWRRCAGGDGDASRCAEARGRAERVLGNLNEPAIPSAQQARAPE